MAQMKKILKNVLLSFVVIFITSAIMEIVLTKNDNWLIFTLLLSCSYSFGYFSDKVINIYGNKSIVKIIWCRIMLSLLFVLSVMFLAGIVLKTKYFLDVLLYTCVPFLLIFVIIPYSCNKKNI